MKYFLLLLAFVINIKCTPKQTITKTDNSLMIQKLIELKKEEKFVAGSNDWPEYTGCKNPEEKDAYSKNLNELIDILITAINDKKDKKYLEKQIQEYMSKADELQESFKVETDESETQYMYFLRIKKICKIES